MGKMSSMESDFNVEVGWRSQLEQAERECGGFPLNLSEESLNKYRGAAENWIARFDDKNDDRMTFMAKSILSALRLEARSEGAEEEDERKAA